jgi:hypothetical protein
VPSCASAGGGCNYICLGGDCGRTGSATGFFGGCGAKNNTCAGEGNCGSWQWCDSNCNIFGNNCDCHYICVQCWNGPASAGSSGCVGQYCNTCNVCTGCKTNPGCETNSGCHSCGPYPDGSICDYTTPGANCSCPNAWQGKSAGGRGGGIVILAAGALDLSGGGAITARGGAPAGGNFGGSGGSIFVKTGRLKLPASGVQIDASGAAGGGAGRVRIDRGLGDDPVARGQVFPAPYTSAFALPQAQSRTLALPGGKSATAVKLLQALDAGSLSYFVSSDRGATWKPIAVGGTVTFAASPDVRWRAQLTPLFGAPASVAGLSLLLTIQ